MLTIDDFKKVDIRIGEIRSVEKVPDTDKLLRLEVDLGEEKPRQIISGIALYYGDIGMLVGKKCAFVANLEPRVIRGLESQGMVMAVSDVEGHFSLLEPIGDIIPGTRIS